MALPNPIKIELQVSLCLLFPKLLLPLEDLFRHFPAPLLGHEPIIGWEPVVGLLLLG